MSETIVIKRNKLLIEKYPWLLPRNRWTDEVIEDYDYTYTELDDMPYGWRVAFGEQMCEELQKALDMMDPEEAKKFRVVQIKEKYGSLRFYPNWVTDQIAEILYKYSVMSEHICISCGAPATKMSLGWICPWCDSCASKLHNENFKNIIIDKK